MCKNILCLSVSIGLLVWGMTGCAQDTAKKLAVNEVPQKIMDPVNARFPGAQVTSVERGTEDGNVIYDFELVHQGRKYEMDVKDDGTVMEIEKEVATANVPQAVSAAVRAKHPQATIRQVMEVDMVSGTQEKPNHYEFTLATADGKEMDVTVSLDGSTVNEETP